jgi:hypothetical protein
LALHAAQRAIAAQSARLERVKRPNINEKCTLSSEASSPLRSLQKEGYWALMPAPRRCVQR